MFRVVAILCALSVAKCGGIFEPDKVGPYGIQAGCGGTLHQRVAETLAGQLGQGLECQDSAIMIT